MHHLYEALKKSMVDKLEFNDAYIITNDDWVNSSELIKKYKHKVAMCDDVFLYIVLSKKEAIQFKKKYFSNNTHWGIYKFPDDKKYTANDLDEIRYDYDMSLMLFPEEDAKYQNGYYLIDVTNDL